jgi:hypothetical protein
VLDRPDRNGFPRRYTLLFAIVAVLLIGGGGSLWRPAHAGTSTARSDSA